MNLFAPIINDQEALYSLIKNSDDPAHIVLKNVLQGWFDNYPDSHQNHLQKRFHNPDRRQHCSAFFELYWHEWLRGEGFEVACLDDDGKNGKTPDYLVSCNGAALFYLECALVADSDKGISDQKKRYQIINWINKSGLTGVEVYLKFGATENSNPEKISFINFLTQKVSELKKDGYATTAVGKEYDIEWIYNSPEINLRIFPYRCENINDPIRVNMQTTGDVSGGGQDKILRTLTDKAKKQKNCKLDIPYVVAINLAETDRLGDTSIDDFIARTTLLGNYSVNMKSGIGSHSLKESFWFDLQGKHRNTSVSAVIWCSSLMPWNYADRNPVVWHHPFAKTPLSLNFLPLSQMTPYHERGKQP